MKISRRLKFGTANTFLLAINCQLHMEGIEIYQTNHITAQKDIPEEEREIHVEWMFMNITKEQTETINNIFK